jgi:hypothetical protein
VSPACAQLDTPLLVLSLAECDLGSQGAAAIAAAIKRHATLRELSLRACNLASVASAPLPPPHKIRQSSAGLPSVRHDGAWLEILSSEAPDGCATLGSFGGIRALIDSLRANVRLLSIDLSGNQVDLDAQAHSMLAAMRPRVKVEPVLSAE